MNDYNVSDIIKKRNLMEILTEKAILTLQERRLERDMNIFMEDHGSNKIYLYDKAWNKIIHLLQPTVYYIPSEDDVKSVFYLELAGKQWQIYTYLDGGL